MRFSVVPVIAALSACSAATSSLPRSSNMFNLDWTKQNAMETINQLMDQLPVDIDIWGMNQTDGFMGVNVALDINDLSSMGLISMKHNANAKINVNVTITGLD
ncbi:hypothetical protein BDV59DRAFT_69916 [Aspergillus ambiguus]|uniref:uncharacterized protein n=1 Tax=Aspergillus ambiguus TaxID=176160 RepID=UPI003CCDB516